VSLFVAQRRATRLELILAVCHVALRDTKIPVCVRKKVDLQASYCSPLTQELRRRQLFVLATFED
jgi:hypothetical protein